MVLKKIFIMLFFFAAVKTFAQKSFTYDYVLEYEYTINNILKKEYRFFNSKDNSSMLTIAENGDAIAMSLKLDDGSYFMGSMPTNDFFVEAISLKCPARGKLKSSSYSSLKDHDFVTQNDTVIDGQTLNHFILMPTKKKKSNVPVHYIVDNKLSLNMPVAEPMGLLYRYWKKGTKIPNGLIKDCYKIVDGKKVSITQLVQCVPIKKIIIIDLDCK